MTSRRTCVFSTREIISSHRAPENEADDMFHSRQIRSQDRRGFLSHGIKGFCRKGRGILSLRDFGLKGLVVYRGFGLEEKEVLS